MLTLIVARARNGAIGRDNKIPWQVPEDLAFFQRETTGGALIMGRRTWESLPVKPLKNRLNLVVSSGQVPAAQVVTSPQAALAQARAEGHARIYGIGGAGIYAALLPLADRLLISEVAIDVPDADTFFPALPEDAWHKASQIRLRTADPACVAVEYLRQYRD